MIFFALMIYIGRCHDQRPGLPNGVGPTDVMYGVKTIKGKKNISHLYSTHKQVHSISGLY